MAKDDARGKEAKTAVDGARTTTISGLTVDPVYVASDRPPENAPGEYPYTRGIHGTMYRGKLWTMRQYAGFGTASETNRRFRYLLEQGSTGLSVAFDLPTQMGRDSDHVLARGEVGRVGVAISTVEDLAVLFDGIPLEKVSISMTINATASILLSMVLVLAEQRGVSWDKLTGTVQNDVLKEYIARGTFIYPPRPALRIVTDMLGFCSKHVPQWNTISISGYHIREAGSTAVEELAFTLADGIAYVEAAIKAGLAVDDFAPRLAFFFNCHNDFLEEIAKFRAARRMWAKIMRDRFGAKNPRSQMLRFHTQTAGSSLTAQQPLNNVVRTTVQALAAVLGGTQSLHTNAFDEAIGLPTEESALLALRTQQIVAWESGVAASADPLGGSYLIEAYTDRLEREAEKRLDYIDSLGGMLPAIEQHYPQGEIEASSYRYQLGLESHEIKVAGLNCVTTEDEGREVAGQALDPVSEEQQVRRLAAYRSGRDASAAASAVGRVADAAKGQENLMPRILDALRAKATLGEIADAMRSIFGEHHDGAF